MLNCDFSYQRAAFKLDVKLDIALDRHGQAPITGILGGSGSGKSTFLKVLAGLLKPQQGHIEFNQQVFFDNLSKQFIPSYRRHVGLVFQDGQLFPHLTVRQNLTYGYKLLKPAQRRFELAQIVDLLEIKQLVEQRVTRLSGGEAQRVALGRALLYSPQLLLLDEPLSSLDNRLKQQILPFFLRIRDEMNLPMIYVTHQPSELEFLQASVFHMQTGQLIGS